LDCAVPGWKLSILALKRENVVATRRVLDGVVLGGLAVAAAVIGSLLLPIVVDDAYITFNYARTFYRTGRLAYSTSNPYLSTTAPFYAVLLGVVKWFLQGRLDFPEISKIIGGISIFGTAAFLYLLSSRRTSRLTSITVALLVVTSPLLWLTWGLETAFFVMCVCGSYYVLDNGRHNLSAVWVGLAALTRADGLLTFALQQARLSLRSVKTALVSAAVFLLVLAPMLVWLTFTFGSPVPATLSAKQSQIQSVGITGFYEGTTVLEGIALLFVALTKHAPIHWLYIPVVVLGVLFAPRSRWAWDILIWAGLHVVAYMTLRVAPYYWYYAPLVPATALLTGLFMQGWLARGWGGSRFSRVSATVIVGLLLASHVQLLSGFVQSFSSPVPSPDHLEAKVLPEAKGAIYRQVGEWLNAHSSPDQTVGAIEIGVIGYYADRPVVDLLGLLQPDVSRAIGRGDLFYAIPHYLPDYLVLGEGLFVYGEWLGQDPWFLANYQVVAEFEDERFWGSPLVVLERVSVDIPPMETYEVAEVIIPGLVLSGFALDRTHVHPGDSLRVRLDWQREDQAMRQELQIITYLVDDTGAVGDLRAKTYRTGMWPVGEVASFYMPIQLSESVASGTYLLRVRVVQENQTDAIYDLVPIIVTAYSQ